MWRKLEERLELVFLFFSLEVLEVLFSFPSPNNLVCVSVCPSQPEHSSWSTTQESLGNAGDGGDVHYTPAI